MHIANIIRSRFMPMMISRHIPRGLCTAIEGNAMDHVKRQRFTRRLVQRLLLQQRWQEAQTFVDQTPQFTSIDTKTVVDALCTHAAHGEAETQHVLHVLHVLSTLNPGFVNGYTLTQLYGHMLSLERMDACISLLKQMTQVKKHYILLQASHLLQSLAS